MRQPGAMFVKVEGPPSSRRDRAPSHFRQRGKGVLS
jgi:hypothetical protein